MPYDPQIHHRRSIRLKGYDYSQRGAYFVTIDVQDMQHLFGEIRNGEMFLNEYGKIVHEKWLWLADQYQYIELDEWIIMPNHFHGILILKEDTPPLSEAGEHCSPNLETDQDPENLEAGEDSQTACTGGSRTAHTETGEDAPNLETGEDTPNLEGNKNTPNLQPGETSATTRLFPKRKPLGRLIGAFKTVTTKYINLLRDTPGRIVWKRDFYEHIIRNDEDLERIRKYINNNPNKWEMKYNN